MQLVQIERTEPTTGGKNRTPRERIEPVFHENDLVEPDLAADASSSEGWPWRSDPTITTWALQLEAMRQVIIASAGMDSQAAAEQAGGSDERGGWYTGFFNQDLIVVGEGDDDGDLNETNFERKIAAIRVENDRGEMVPLPWGGTAVMPTISYLDGHYLGEFAKDEETGLLVPVAKRPKRARAVFTDGAMTDYAALGHRLEAEHKEIAEQLLRDYPDLAEFLEGHEGDLWPGEEWFVAIIGESGDAHDKALKLYQDIAKRHSSVHVYSFERVTNPAEIAEDVAIAMLNRKAA